MRQLTLAHSDRLAQEEQRLLPMRRDALRPRAKARVLLLLRIRTRAALGRRLPAHRPHLRELRLPVLHDGHLGALLDGRTGRGEEGVEVEHEGADFGALVVGGDQLEGGDEVELGGGDVAEVEVLWGVRCGRGDGSADTLP